jgi:hypothetical protein
MHFNVLDQPTTSPTIIQTPVEPIIEGNKVTLTCTIQGGNPVATITWSCDGAPQITPTGSPSTEDAISSVELVSSKNNNGQMCTCTGRHLLSTIMITSCLPMVGGFLRVLRDIAEIFLKAALKRHKSTKSK